MQQTGFYTKIEAIATVIIAIATVIPLILIILPINPKEQIVETPKKTYENLEYTLHEYDPQFIKNAQTNLSVAFKNIGKENFVTLIISPLGKKSSSHAVLDSYTKEFKSSVGVFNIQILKIDYDSKRVLVQVSRKT
ncbi:hypothetical protein DO021_17350 [Desulfobacter hydrogenophilus]|uniref:Uncharacterized protein n=1 Tax=Desulfobacter hydrogenophilus TaxID=2291 RepID=A0A328FCB2_9BACT|nr:hypothetical protein [Desulfobacter hydrogenophilus]NDY73407.1 hypothetical protein [Desulfobacter hydrogenophilus]QBH12426.1 hypothetical protein EYB58_05580 [Desulfobacter hydrogenophilus]RAM00735.1 hypothetical protein DO021_17350 [Desulfobacter hydrogenophilus]